MRSASVLRRAASALVWAAMLALPFVSGGCAAHAPMYRREHLADRIMSFEAQAKADARRMKALEAREGSTGGGGGAGGGCACK